MRFVTDTLNHVKLLVKFGLAKADAEAIVTAGSTVEITNVYEKGEVNKMLNDSTTEWRNNFDDLNEKVSQAIKSQSRWIITTLIAGFAALASLHIVLH